MRPLLAEPADDALSAPLNPVLDALRQAGAAMAAALDGLHGAGTLTGAPSDIHSSLVHLHLNRLLAADLSTERRVLGLLARLRGGLKAAAPMPSKTAP